LVTASFFFLKLKFAVIASPSIKVLWVAVTEELFQAAFFTPFTFNVMHFNLVRSLLATLRFRRQALYLPLGGGQSVTVPPLEFGFFPENTTSPVAMGTSHGQEVWSPSLQRLDQKASFPHLTGRVFLKIAT